MTELYRLRSMAKLFGDCQELEKQSIYFASPGKLNDPMEGFRDIVWQGDRIVWTNLFRHYLYCLHMTYALIKFVGDSIKVKSKNIPVMGHMDQQLTPKAVKLCEDICGRVFEKTNLHVFISKIVNAKRKVHYDELLLYLQLLHYTALLEIQDAYTDHGFVPNGERREKFPTVFRHVHKMLDLVPQIEEERFLEVLFECSSRIMEEMFIRQKYNHRLASESASEDNRKLEQNRQLLIYDFPTAYLKELGRLLYPDWYVACFMRDYCNSSAWGHYGDNHKGVCLIFEAETKAGANSLTLKRITGYSAQKTADHLVDREHWRPSPVTFHDMNYEDKVSEIDFFRSIGWLPIPMLLKMWYSDQGGNLSKCGAHLRTDGEDAWRKNYWANFYRDITAKTRDWEYEQESRLILYSMIADLSEARRRTLTYNFSSLKGIIFGINTSDRDKLKIMETIHKKCQENSRTDFDFFQAYYCHETGDIQRYKLLLKFSA